MVLKIILFIYLGLSYTVGLFSVKFLDSAFPEEKKYNKVVHISTLVLLWLMMPIMIPVFLIITTKAHIKKKRALKAK